MDEIKFNIESIEEIKRMQKDNLTGWSKYLASYCKVFFDAKASLPHTRKRLAEFYDINVGIDTLRILRNKYRAEAEKNLSPTKANSTTPISLSPSVSKSPTEVKTELNTIPNQKKRLSKEEQEKLIEEAVKAMEEAEHRAAYPKNDFDDYLERQQAKKNSLNNT